MSKIQFSKQVFIEYIFLTIGAAIMAIGIAVFLTDTKVVPGGVTGLSQIIYYITGGKIGLGVLMWGLNIPLYLWGLKELGSTFAFRTFYSFTLNSFFIELFRGGIWKLEFIKLHEHPAIIDMMKNDFFFMIFIGAVFLGIGLGIIFKFKGTTAGSDIVASIMNKKWGIKPGQAIMIIDFFVISSASIVFAMSNIPLPKNIITISMFAFFLLYLSSKIIDMILDGFDYARAAYIISDKHVEIGDTIIRELKKGATALKTRGIYRNVDREMIMTVVTMKDLPKLKDIVADVDPDAFVIISNVHEVLGEGFRRRV